MRLRRPSPALVIACIALFVSLGGVGYAAATGSIDSRLVNRSGAAALLTYGNGTELLSPNESFNVGDVGTDDGSSGQAGFVVDSAGRAVRAEWSLAENALGHECYLSGLVTG